MKYFGLLLVFSILVFPAFLYSAVNESGTIEGRVVDEQNAGIPGVTVTLEGPGIQTLSTTTDEEGKFKFKDVPAPARYHVVHTMGDRRTSRLVVTKPGAIARMDLPFAPSLLEEVTVTGTRDEQLLRETPATVDVISQEALQELKPAHPSQALNRVPGVWVNATNGEGHMTAIRQPLTTNPVYLFLEDGVPTRSTGFFNHNALYEINVPSASGMEVTKGPGSALYGSDAIGGVINVLSRSPFGPSGLELSAEGGEYEWSRLLMGAHTSDENDGVRGDFNLTRTDGWRTGTNYDREAGSVRWDRLFGDDWMMKTLASFSLIDQQTAGTSTLFEDDYNNNPTLNLTPISFRDVKAFRLSTDIRREFGDTFVSLIPYFRYNSMELLANWLLTFDPSISDSSNNSYGVLAQLNRAMGPMNGQFLTGFDLDLSPGHRTENIIIPTTIKTDLGRTIFSDYTLGSVIYDYDVRFFAVSPYAQYAITPSSRLRAEFGLRYDHMGYKYDDLLTTAETSRHQRPDDATRSYDHVSPKVGITYQFSNQFTGFASYRHAFRVPSEGQLFRQGSAVNTIDLEPVKAEHYEVGFRAGLPRGISFEISAYQLDKRDDILSFRDPVDGATQSVNAGRTQHRGVEVGLYAAPSPIIDVAVSYGYAKHTYVDWVVDPARNIDFSGNEQEIAPRTLANFLVSVKPWKDTTVSVEAFHLGEYWMDAANTQQYDGHTLVSLRGRTKIYRSLAVFARVHNLTDIRFAETTSFTLQRGRELAPGLPRTIYAGLEFEWAGK